MTRRRVPHVSPSLRDVGSRPPHQNSRPEEAGCGCPMSRRFCETWDDGCPTRIVVRRKPGAGCPMSRRLCETWDHGRPTGIVIRRKPGAGCPMSRRLCETWDHGCPTGIVILRKRSRSPARGSRRRTYAIPPQFLVIPRSEAPRNLPSRPIAQRCWTDSPRQRYKLSDLEGGRGRRAMAPLFAPSPWRRT